MAMGHFRDLLVTRVAHNRQREVRVDGALE
jgi:hypothetical protein